MSRDKKVLVLGIDGMDSRITKKFLDEGKLPNIKKYLERGAARTGLDMLGAIPTITPPCWTTLATGAYPEPTESPVTGDSLRILWML